MAEQIADSAKLRMYVDFSTLLTLIKYNRLSFQRLDLCGEYQNMWYATSEKMYSLAHGAYDNVRTNNRMMRELRDIKELTERVYACSVCAQESESHALWNYQSKYRELVAIVFTYKGFLRSLGQSVNRPVKLKRMNYLELGPESTQILLSTDIVSVICHKDVGYEFKNEALLIIDDIGSMQPPDFLIANNNASIEACAIQIDSKSMIDAILVRPEAEKFVEDVLRGLVQEYLPDCLVRRSDLCSSRLA